MSQSTVRPTIRVRPARPTIRVTPQPNDDWHRHGRQHFICRAAYDAWQRRHGTQRSLFTRVWNWFTT